MLHNAQVRQSSIRSLRCGDAARARGRGRTLRRRALPPGGSGRRDDPPRQAPLDRRPGCRRPAGGPPRARLGARLGHERQDDDDGDGRRDPRRAARLQPLQGAGEPALRAIASTLLDSPGAELGLFEVDEAALPEVARRLQPRLIALGNLFRDQLDRYGELELVAEGWRAAIAEAPGATLVVNADDPLLGDLSSARPETVSFGLDDPSHARPLQHAADSTYCRTCGTPYLYAAAYVGHLGDYRCPYGHAARGPLQVAARAIELHGSDGSAFVLATPAGTVHVELGLPGLYNVYNATAAGAVAHVLGATPDAIAAGLGRFVAAFGRFERIEIAGRRLVILLIKNPAGANEAVRTLLDGSPPRLAVVALNDELADGRDVSWIWDVDFEPLLAGLEHAPSSLAEGAAELALRFAYGELDRRKIEVLPDLGAALDRGLELTGPGEELVVLPTYTARCCCGCASTHRAPGPRP